jgi:hypothetical protein
MCAATPGLEAVQIPYRNEASAIGETVGIPDATYSFDLETNSFAINDDGLVVGAYGLPLDPCSAATAFGQQNPVRARAFVWIPASYTALPAFVPRGQVLDLHTLGALPADGRSIAVDVSRTSAWVTGSSGYPFSLNSKAWAWNLAAAVSSGGSLTSIPATDLHPLLGNAEPAQPESALAGDRSIGTAVRHEAGDAYPIFVGSFTHACGDQPERWKGFRLRLDQLPDTTSLWGMRATLRSIPTQRPKTISSSLGEATTAGVRRWIRATARLDLVHNPASVRIVSAVSGSVRGMTTTRIPSGLLTSCPSSATASMRSCLRSSTAATLARMDFERKSA